ncbi:type II secretion system F family protein [Aneurinibacillus sp. UBA3580]|uniref:type II secretion system F family protein n=1 Tax=Aneurinibacillus sp. UBA3580 TaxID=1946041 RepID=UPI0025808C4E|nr:type II secretion system F family protein [Aneurinibacillus sp. UBA3580]
MSGSFMKRMREETGWSDESLARLSQRLSYLLEAGIPLLDSLQLTSDHFARREKQQILHVLERLEAGAPLSVAFEQMKVPTLFLSLITAGEQHGQYASSFAFAARYYRRRAVWRHQVYQLISYPLLLLILSLVCLWFLLHMIMPQISSMYSAMNLSLPPLTRWLLYAFSLIPSYAVSLAGVLILVLCTALIIHRKHQLVPLLLKLPVIRYWITLQYSHYFAMQAGLLLEAGISILEICRLFHQKAPWFLLREVAAAVENELRHGFSLSHALGAHSCFTKEMVRYIELGEEGGRMGECLLFYSEQIEIHIKQQLEKAMRWLEPVILIGVGGIVFVVVLSFFLPVLQMMNEVK